LDKTGNVPPSLLTGDPVTLDGLLLDGAGTGFCGVLITSGPSVQILNSVTRRFFQSGIIHNTSTNFNTLLIEDTIASDNLNIGFTIRPSGGSVNATLNRITAINSQTGVAGGVNSDTTIANSVISNNSSVGVQSEGVIWLAKTVISGNGNGVNVLPGSTANTYGAITSETTGLLWRAEASRLSRRSDVIGRDKPAPAPLPASTRSWAKSRAGGLASLSPAGTDADRS
jgi:hypothetical protein